METKLIVTVDSRGAVSGSNNINTALDGVRRAARGMVGEVDGSFNKLRDSLFSLRGAIVSLGIGEFLRRSIKDFTDYETGLIKVGKTANISGDALKEMGDTLTQMSTRIPASRNELLSIAEAAGQLGITGSTNIAKFTEVIAKMGSATNLHGEEAATTIARILGNTREPYENAQQLASVITKLGNDSNATEAEIAKMAIEISKATVQFKVSSTNLAALGTTLASFGQQPELARSSMLRTFLTLQQVTQQGGQDLQLLGKLAGMTGAEFKQAFEKDSFGAFLKFTAGLKGVKDAGGSITQVLAAIGLNGTEINAVLPLLAENIDILGKNVASASLEFRQNVALNKEAEAAYASVESKLQLLKNQFTIVSSIIGEKLAPGLITISTKLIALGQSTAVITFAQALGTSFNFLADNIELVGIALATISTVKLIGLFTSLAGSVFGAGNALRLGAIAALQNAAALQAISSNANLGIGSLNRIAVSADILSLRTRTTTIATYLLNTALGTIGLNTSAIARFSSMAAGSQLAAVAIRGLALAFGVLTGPIGITIAVIGGLIALYATFKDSVLSVGKLHASLGNTIQATWNVISQAIGSAVSSATATIRNWFNGIWQQAATIFAAIRDYIGTKINEILQVFGIFYNKIAGVFSSIKEAIVNSFTSAFDSVKNAINNRFGGFIDKIVTEANRLQDRTETTSPGKAAPSVAAPTPIAAPNIPIPTINLKDLNSQLDSGTSKASDFSQTLDQMLTSANREGLSLRMSELQKQLAEVDNRVIDEVGSFDKLTKQQLETVEATKKQITANYELQVTLKEQQEARDRLKQIIEETRTPQEKYNAAMAELARLNPQTAEGIEAVRRKMAELGQELKGTNELTKQFNAGFESTFKQGLESVMRNGKGGFKDMLSGFKDLYFKTVTEIAAKPFLDAILGSKTPGDKLNEASRSGGLFSGVFDSLFGAGSPKPANTNLPPLAPGEKEIQGMPWLKDTGQTLASDFTKSTESSGGFLTSLKGLFASGGEGGGFVSSLGSIFTNLTGSLSSVFGQFGGMFSSMFGMGAGTGGGNILGSIGGMVGNMIMPGMGGMIGSLLGGFFADGGSVKGNVPIIVGERGPELFVPPTNGEIISNEALKNLPTNDNIRGIPDDVARGAMQAHLAGNFAGFFAGGGKVAAGSAIVGGERGRELFIPEQAPSVSVQATGGGGKGGDSITVNITVNTPDTTTFRRSQGQIMAEAAAAMQRARRNL